MDGRCCKMSSKVADLILPLKIKNKNKNYHICIYVYFLVISFLRVEEKYRSFLGRDTLLS